MKETKWNHKKHLIEERKIKETKQKTQETNRKQMKDRRFKPPKY